MSDRVIAACEAQYEAHKGDCSGFVRAVAAELGVEVDGLADQIVATLRSSAAPWTVLANGVEAKARAEAGFLVVAGLKGSEQTTPNAHGHVVVVVAGPLAHGAYPSAYWGSLGGTPAKNTTLNYAWVKEDRDRIVYAAAAIA